MVKWIVAGVVAVIVIAGGVYLIVHKSSKSPSYSTSSGSTYSSGSSSQPSTSSSTNSTGNIVQTKTDSSGVQYLADAKSDPLYTYGGDTAGVSNCTGSCISVWPIYAPTSSSPSLPTNLSVIKRSDGSSQYAYKGQPLYTFASDSAGGNPTGDNVNNFHLAKP